jgi:hypothetical protein
MLTPAPHPQSFLSKSPARLLFCPGAIRGSFFILEFLLLVPFGKRNERVPVSSSYNYRGLMFAVSQVDYFRAKAIECEKLARSRANAARGGRRLAHAGGAK